MSAGVMRIVVHGKPVPQGSVRSLGAGRPSVHGNADRLHPWRDSIITATQAAMVEYGWERGDGPASVYGVFTFDRPKSHFTPRETLRTDAPSWPITRANGDLDKLARSVGDALTAAGAIKDDSQIASWMITKQYVTRDLVYTLRHPGLVLDLRWLKP